MVDRNLNRFDIWLALKMPEKPKLVENLGLCVIVSPDELNNLDTRVILPITNKFADIPSRVNFNFNNTKAYIMIEQIRVIDNSSFVNKLGSLDITLRADLCNKIEEFFAL